MNETPDGGSSESAPEHSTPPSYSVPTLELKGEKTLKSHPWIYRQLITSFPQGLSDGDEVAVVAADGEPVGRGFYHGRSQIAVRIMTPDAERALDLDFLRERLEIAISLRLDTLRLDRVTDSWRVVHGEGDGLGGLVIDKFNDLLVVQPYSYAFYRRREELGAILEELFPDHRQVLKPSSVAARREGIPEYQPPESPEELDVEIKESKVRLLVNPSGHKTGFFLDQRENRARLVSMVRGKKVLDGCCYTGAMAIAARTLGKAGRVIGVDLDEEALEMARRNEKLNRASIEWVHEDIFHYLKKQRHAVEPFEVIIIDPPKWARERDRFEEAERRYLDINKLAMQAIAPGGILLTCSCSGLVSPEHFHRILQHAAELSGRDFRIFHHGGAASDHPVSSHCPESRYLKAVFGRVF
jgi:23S rRNA (cytosine1962-C5)-methyltransferase